MTRWSKPAMERSPNGTLTAIHIFVSHLMDKLTQIPKGKPTVAHCSVGYRSGLAASFFYGLVKTKCTMLPGE